jgi:protein TonB
VATKPKNKLSVSGRSLYHENNPQTHAGSQHGLARSAVDPAAMSFEQAYIESYRGRTDIPAPVKVVAPSVSSEYAGTTVELVFTVDSSGVPQHIAVRTAVDRELARVLTDAVQHWRFAPEQREGHPLAAKVMLPIRIVDQVRRTIRASRPVKHKQ